MSDVLVAGIGNVFQTDDGFGVEVAGQLALEDLPARVKVEDFGIRGVHLAYELLEGYSALILVDAVPMGEAPGTLAVLEPEVDSLTEGAGGVDAHTMGPEVVLSNLARLGGTLDCIYIVGCQPADLSDGIGLTPAVASSVENAVDLCIELLNEITQPADRGTS
ncbi:MAG TPA: hydrogenase maturation protease [Acidimicrobiales bacterium]|jgi:hydrogenase maturation protease